MTARGRGAAGVLALLVACASFDETKGGNETDAGADGGAASTDADTAGDADDTMGGTVLPSILDRRALWLRADSLGLADGAIVDTWKDRGDPPRVFTAPESGARPTFVAAGGGVPATVRFPERALLELQGPDAAHFSYSAAQAFSVAVVVRTAGLYPETFGQVFGNEWSAAPERIGFTVTIDSAGTKAAGFGVRRTCVTGNCVSARGARDVMDNRWHLLLGIRDGDVARLFVDGEADGETKGAGVSLDGAEVLALGSSYGTLPYAGDIAEVAIWERAFRQPEIAALTLYARRRYGTP